MLMCSTIVDNVVGKEFEKLNLKKKMMGIIYEIAGNFISDDGNLMRIIRFSSHSFKVAFSILNISCNIF